MKELIFGGWFWGNLYVKDGFGGTDVSRMFLRELICGGCFWGNSCIKDAYEEAHVSETLVGKLMHQATL